MNGGRRHFIGLFYKKTTINAHLRYLAVIHIPIVCISAGQFKESVQEPKEETII